MSEKPPLYELFNQNKGKPCDVYLSGDEDCWELKCVDQMFFDLGHVFFAGKDKETGAIVIFNLHELKNIVFYNKKPKTQKNNVTPLRAVEERMQGILCPKCANPILIHPDRKDDFVCQNCYKEFGDKH